MFSFRAAATAERFGSKRWSKADFCYWACGITSSRPAGRRIGDMNTNRPHSWNESCRHHRHLPPIVSHPLVCRPYQSRFALGLIRGTGGRGKQRNVGGKRRRR